MYLVCVHWNSHGMCWVFTLVLVYCGWSLITRGNLRLVIFALTSGGGGDVLLSVECVCGVCVWSVCVECVCGCVYVECVCGCVEGVCEGG